MRRGDKNSARLFLVPLAPSRPKSKSLPGTWDPSGPKSKTHHSTWEPSGPKSNSLPGIWDPSGPRKKTLCGTPRPSQVLLKFSMLSDISYMQTCLTSRAKNKPKTWFSAVDYFFPLSSKISPSKVYLTNGLKEDIFSSNLPISIVHFHVIWIMQFPPKECSEDLLPTIFLLNDISLTCHSLLPYRLDMHG